MEKEQRQMIQVKLQDNSYCYVFHLKGKDCGVLFGVILPLKMMEIQYKVQFLITKNTGLGDEISTERYAAQFEGSNFLISWVFFSLLRWLRGVANSNVDPNHGVDAVSGDNHKSRIGNDDNKGAGALHPPF